MVKNSSYVKTFLDQTFLPDLDRNQKGWEGRGFLNCRPLQYTIETIGKVTLTSFRKHCESQEGQKERPWKIFMPLYALNGILKTVAHLFKALVQALFVSKDSALRAFYKAGRDLEETLGSVIRLFHEAAGAYLMEEAHFYREVYDQMGRCQELSLHDAQCAVIFEGEVIKMVSACSTAFLSNLLFKELELDSLTRLNDAELRVVLKRLDGLKPGDKEKIAGLRTLSSEEILQKQEPILSVLLPLLSKEQIQGLDFTRLSNKQIQGVFTFNNSRNLEFSVHQYAKLLTVPLIPRAIFRQISLEKVVQLAPLVDLNNVEESHVFGDKLAKDVYVAFVSALTMEQIKGCVAQKKESASWLMRMISPEKINQYLTSAQADWQGVLKSRVFVQSMFKTDMNLGRLSLKNKDAADNILRDVPKERQMQILSVLGFRCRDFFAEAVREEFIKKLTPEKVNPYLLEGLTSADFAQFPIECQYSALQKVPLIATLVTQVAPLITNMSPHVKSKDRKEFVLNLVKRSPVKIVNWIGDLDDAVRQRVFNLLGVTYAQYFFKDEREAFVQRMSGDKLEMMIEEMKGVSSELAGEIRSYLSDGQKSYLAEQADIASEGPLRRRLDAALLDAQEKGMC